MSVDNPTGPPNSTNGTAHGASGPGSGDLGQYVASIEDTAPFDIVDRPAPAADPEAGRRQRALLSGKRQAAGVPMIGGRDENDAVARLAAEIRQAEQENELLANPAWLDRLSPAERDAERASAEKVRAAMRVERTEAALAKVGRDRRGRKHGDRLALITEKLNQWKAEALAKRDRLLDPATRLAELHRAHRASTIVLRLLMLVGIGWTSVGVHDALMGPDSAHWPTTHWLAYGVEPLFSGLLLLTMNWHAQGARWGRPFPGGGRARLGVIAFEVSLLLAVVLINISPVVPVLGTWHNTETFWARFLPPLLIAATVVMQVVIAGFVAKLMISALVEGKATTRLSADEVSIARLVRQIPKDLDAGVIAASAESNYGLPSASAVAKWYGIGKPRAGAAVDFLEIMAGRE